MAPSRTIGPRHRRWVDGRLVWSAQSRRGATTQTPADRLRWGNLPRSPVSLAASPAYRAGALALPASRARLLFHLRRCGALAVDRRCPAQFAHRGTHPLRTPGDLSRQSILASRTLLHSYPHHLSGIGAHTPRRRTAELFTGCDCCARVTGWTAARISIFLAARSG